MLVWGQSGTLLKEQGSYELDISLKDIERPSKWPTFIGTERAQNHLLFYSILFYLILFYSILFYSKGGRRMLLETGIGGGESVWI